MTIIGIRNWTAPLKLLVTIIAQHVYKLEFDDQVADVANISENTLSPLEAGKLNTTVSTCFEIAKALKVEVKDLFDF